MLNSFIMQIIIQQTIITMINEANKGYGQTFESVLKKAYNDPTNHSVNLIKSNLTAIDVALQINAICNDPWLAKSYLDKARHSYITFLDSVMDCIFSRRNITDAESVRLILEKYATYTGDMADLCKCDPTAGHRFQAIQADNIATVMYCLENKSLLTEAERTNLHNVVYKYRIDIIQSCVEILMDVLKKK